MVLLRLLKHRVKLQATTEPVNGYVIKFAPSGVTALGLSAGTSLFTASEKGPPKHREDSASAPSRVHSSSRPTEAPLAIGTDDDCPVCLTREHLPFRVLSCRHSFCSPCLQSFYRVKPHCPICRAFILPEDVMGTTASSQSAALNESTPPAIHDSEWNVEIARTHARWSEANQRGERQLLLFPSSGQNQQEVVRTNIYVSGNPRGIQVTGNPNIVINGRKIENPQDCAQQ